MEAPYHAIISTIVKSVAVEGCKIIHLCQGQDILQYSSSVNQRTVLHPIWDPRSLKKRAPPSLTSSDSRVASSFNDLASDKQCHSHQHNGHHILKHCVYYRYRYTMHTSNSQYATYTYMYRWPGVLQMLGPLQWTYYTCTPAEAEVFHWPQCHLMHNVMSAHCNINGCE
jgi:hypothetical protein